MRYVASSRATVLELPEPLWIRFLPINVWLAAAWRMSGFFRMTSRRARTYAIENNDPATVIFGIRTPPAPIRKLGLFAVGLIFASLFEKVAFGTEGSARAYRSLPFADKVQSTVIAALPAPLSNPPGSAGNGSSAIFVGSLDARKGIYDLMFAWPLVERQIADASLTIVGDGPANEAAAQWSSESPLTRKFAGRLSHEEAVAEIAKARVVVAPSKRDGRWREQVGLPIVEGLSAGLTIVTSEDSGLSSWLAAAGHRVFSTSPGPEVLSSYLVDGLRSPLNRAEVLRSLPAQHGRISADEWLHSD